MKKLFVLLLVCFYSLINAQETGSLRGIITDSGTGETVIYANVFIKGTTIGAPTNTRGYYFVPSVPVGKQLVVISYLGYKKKTVEVVIQSNKITELSAALEPDNVKLDVVNIVSEKSIRDTETDLGLQKISAREIEMQPHGAEADIFRVIKSAPGVSATGDVTAKFFVRGGNSDQNMVVMNGVPIYNPFHAMGIFSVIDPEVISQMNFYKGGFGPEYGGRLSSVLDVVTKDGNKNRIGGTATFGMLSGKAMLEGPLGDGSYIFSGRKSYHSGILKKYLNDKEAPFNFYDLSFKINQTFPELDKNSKFTIHGFYSFDEVKNENPLEEDHNISNLVLGSNWQKIWSTPLFSVFSLYYSGFDAELDPKLGSSKGRKNHLYDISANFDFTYVYGNKDEFDFGLQTKHLSTELEIENVYNNKATYNETGTELALYGNYKFYRWEKIGFEAGMRIFLNGISNVGPIMLEPRFSFTYRPWPFIALKAAIARHSQEISTLADENELISIFEPWIITPENIAPPEATHFIIGIKSYFSDKLSLELEAYYKDLANLLEPNYEKYSEKYSDYTRVNGYSYGGEALLKWNTPFMFFKTGYSLSWSEKKRDGLTYRPRFDIRHSLNILLGFALGNGWKFNTSWSLKSGMPYTPLSGYYERLNISNPWSYNYITPPSSTVTLRSFKNSKELPFYHRLDVGVSKKLKLGFLDLTIDANIINVYDRKNVFYYDLETKETVYMLPFLPSLSVKAKL
ncbi:MAG: TonB-dependent receptor [Melioribacteraceae bacterium]|nr:TonB-dependent receptor [Melioribacteraceae bacterium]